MSSFLKNTFHLIKNRFVVFVIFLIVFMGTQSLFSKSLLPSQDEKDLWFYSGIFMVLFSILFIEPYYSSPKNVITNAIPLLLVLLAIRNTFINQAYWWLGVITLLFLLFASIVCMAMQSKDQSDEGLRNKISNGLKGVVVFLGQGKVLYSVVFVYFLLTYYSIQDYYVLVMFFLWAFILCINPKSIHNDFYLIVKNKNADQIGEIIGVQSKKIFLVKLFDDRKSIKKFDVVEFNYSMQDINGLVITGIIFDTYLLNQEKWSKVLQLAAPRREVGKYQKNIVYKITETEKIKVLNKELRTDDFVGIVIEGTTIGKIKFEYSKKTDDLQEGDLLELDLNGKRLFYQVVAGITIKENLETRNETGFIEGDALQLGEWVEKKLSFQKFGWVPSINTPIFKAKTDNIEIRTFGYPDYKLGVIPGTQLPSVINLNDAVSHHMALLGITGSGKSFLAREIIKQLVDDTKVICIDFTGEWKKFSAEHIILNKENIADFLSERQSKVGVVELPVMSNTTVVLQSTEKLFETIFGYGKKKYDDGAPVRISLVLEEAHTITPETTFLGDLGEYGANKAIVNKMGQVALQGRKYGIGLLVIAQRTANVSKTVLTQCNTVICFQAFDETSFTFLGNYVGKEMVQALPNLKQYHAIVAGKAIRSNVPMIIDLTRK